MPNVLFSCSADMDGFKLLETIGLEMGLPVISGWQNILNCLSGVVAVVLMFWAAIDYKGNS